MKRIELIRIEKKVVPITDQTKATYGIMRIDDKYFCCTLEPPERGNVTDKDGCIPAGIYVCKRTSRPPKWPDIFEIQDVPNRYGILIHRGNYDPDTTGCILLGTSFGIINGKQSIYDTVTAFNNFMAYWKGVDEFEIKIIEV